MVKVVLRGKMSGSPVDTVISQSNWNLDKMDGTGLSGITLDFSKSQIYFFDMEWLGVGRGRYGFFHNGVPIYCHETLNSNVISTVYMSTPNLPIRFSIENDWAGAATTMAQICATVISEGGSDDMGILRYKSTEGTHVDCDVENTIYAIVGIRLKSTHLGGNIKIQRIAIQLTTSSETGEWIWILNPTIAGTFTYADETNSVVQTATGALANTVTNGTKVTGGFAESSSGGFGSGGIVSPIPNALLLGALIDGTVDEMVLCWRPNGGTSGHDIEGSITWREFN